MIAPLSPSSSATAAVPAAVSDQAVHTLTSSHAQVCSLNTPLVQATGRLSLCGISLNQATHSSSPQGRMSPAPCEVWMLGMPLLSTQLVAEPVILVTPP